MQHSSLIADGSECRAEGDLVTVARTLVPTAGMADGRAEEASARHHQGKVARAGLPSAGSMRLGRPSEWGAQ